MRYAIVTGYGPRAPGERYFVRKAVSWALRAIGERNLRLNGAATEAARGIQEIDGREARWIASDAMPELESEVDRGRLAR